MVSPDQSLKSKSKNQKFLLWLTVLVLLMIGFAYASVPLYKLFCQKTGFAGTIRRTEVVPTTVLARQLTIRFNADVSPHLPWTFTPEVQKMELKVGQTGLMNYKVTNMANRPVIGVAVYNVTPNKAGLYFAKVQCFCFDEQLLEANQTVDMPVFFYIDPKIQDDPDLNDIDEITLSYSFFEANTKEYTHALENYYRTIEKSNYNNLKEITSEIE